MSLLPHMVYVVSGCTSCVMFVVVPRVRDYIVWAQTGSFLPEDKTQTKREVFYLKTRNKSVPETFFKKQDSG
jgi:hypothetical protein